MTERFDLLTAPLVGRNLVEASAGTGKTFSLAGLFLRLVVEDGLAVDEILVVTFTDAATAELRGRIRERLRSAQEAFRSGDPKGDPLLAHLLGLAGDARERAPERLAAAVRCFDEAAISTIHGFCQRVLAERAFECGASLGAEVLPDPSALLEEVVADHWRTHLYGASAGFVRYVQGQGADLGELSKWVKAWAGRTNLTVVPPVADADPGPAEAEVARRFEAVSQAWPGACDAVLHLLASDTGLLHTSLKKPTVAKMGAQMDAYAAGDDPLATFEWLPRFGTVFVESQIKPGSALPSHPFWGQAQALVAAREALVAAYRDAWIAFRAELLALAGRELPARLARQGVRTFDALLAEVYRAVIGPSGERLAQALRARFRAALIDEFQDTDPLQYGIFHRVFGLAGADTGGPRLFLIGDPKQAIYGFRGADLFAYLGAARAADASFTLEENWRSTPGLLTAVEQLFTRGANPFVFPEIGFVSVRPGGGGKPPLVLDGVADPAPLRVWRLPVGPDGKPPTKGRIVPALHQAVAAEVLALVTAGRAGRATLEGRPLEPGDVAVLVRTHAQGRGVQQALAARRIPSVIASTQSLFASAEAGEVLRLVAALAEPTHEGRVRAALATELVGVTGAELHALGENERGWEGWLERFGRYHGLWAERGFVTALRTALVELGVRERLLAYPDGERRVTNLLHLAEVLHGAAGAGHLGPQALVAWLGRRLADQDAAEEYQLRLETDAQAVQVVTVHKSKGLQYPVVFCPFLWEGLRDAKNDPAVACHDPNDPSRLVLDLGSDDQARHRALARREELAERVRLVYVAVTRAKQRCYVAWGAVNRGEDAALGYLLHAPAPVRSAAPEALVADLSVSAVAGRGGYEAELDELAAAAGGAIAVEPLPPPTREVYADPAGPQETLERLAPPAHIPRDWGVTSYSGLVSGRAEWSERAEHPDRDEGTAPALDAPGGEEPERAPAGAADIFAFPRGARAGTCLHAILEELDFPAADRTALAAQVGLALPAHGFDPAWTPAVTACLTQVLDAPLLGADAGFRLRDLSLADRLTELEFHLPLGTVTPAGLAGCLTEDPELAARVERLGFRPLRGLLKGFVDLTFRHKGRVYVLDWKSNHLGNRPADYGSAALPAAMAEHHYDLQALLYSVALHCYLERRWPGYRYDEHFGGAVYVFLRGVDGTAEHGLVRTRFPAAQVTSLARYLAKGEGGHG